MEMERGGIRRLEDISNLLPSSATAVAVPEDLAGGQWNSSANWRLEDISNLLPSAATAVAVPEDFARGH
jgi:hypothetical protein